MCVLVLTQVKYDPYNHILKHITTYLNILVKHKYFLWPNETQYIRVELYLFLFTQVGDSGEKGEGRQAVTSTPNRRSNQTAGKKKPHKTFQKRFSWDYRQSVKWDWYFSAKLVMFSTEHEMCYLVAMWLNFFEEFQQ